MIIYNWQSVSYIGSLCVWLIIHNVYLYHSFVLPTAATMYINRPDGLKKMVLKLFYYQANHELLWQEIDGYN